MARIDFDDSEEIQGVNLPVIENNNLDSLKELPFALETLEEMGEEISSNPSTTLKQAAPIELTDLPVQTVESVAKNHLNTQEIDLSPLNALAPVGTESRLPRCEGPKKEVSLEFPSLGAAAVDLCLQKEAEYLSKVEDQSKAIEKNLTITGKLIDLNKELVKASRDAKTFVLTDEVKKTLEDLESFGVRFDRVLKEKMTREDLAVLKELIDAEKDKLKTKTQIHNNRLSTIFNRLEQLLNAMKKIVEDQIQAMSAINRKAAS